VGVVGVTWPISAFWGSGHIFGADEAKHFKFGLQIERKEYYHYILYVGLQTDIIRLLTGLLYFTSLTLSGLNYYELLATCSKYSTDVSHMSENIITQSKIWNMFSYTV